MIRLLLDQGLPRSAASILVESEWDALHVGDLGLSRATDKEIIEYARRENRICVTLDADFHAILAFTAIGVAMGLSEAKTNPVLACTVGGFAIGLAITALCRFLNDDY